MKQSNDRSVNLPDQHELEYLYTTYRKRYFRRDSVNNQADESLTYWIPPVEDVEIAWSTRLTSSAGICYPKRRIIRLSTHYHRRFLEEVGATLLHEMIHLIVPGHGAEFYAWLNRITAMGGTVHRYARERATPPRWEYVCVTCSRRYPRQRRLPQGGRNHRCRLCRTTDGVLIETGPFRDSSSNR